MSDERDKIDRVATAIAIDAMRQNKMLEFCTRETSGAIGFYDDYDNKFYDCEEIARAAIAAMPEPAHEPKPA